jgi:hypothetical protein
MNDVTQRTRTAGGHGDDGAGGADIEGMARRAGWLPEDEWKGKKEKWVDASVFVDRLLQGSSVSERYKQLDGRFADLERQNSATRDQLGKVTKTLEETTSILSEFREYNQNVAQRAYERAKAELEARHDRAVDDGDKAAAKKAVADLAKLEDEKPKPKPAAAAEPAKKPDEKPADQQQQQLSAQDKAVIDSWVKENDWYKPAGTDRMTTMAVAAYHEIQQENPGWTIRQVLDQVRADVVEAFPKRFPNERKKDDDEEEEVEKPASRKKAADVIDSDLTSGGDGGNKRTERPKGQRWSDLPKEAQEACNRFCAMKVQDKDGKMVPMMTREKYLDDYDWGK